MRELFQQAETRQKLLPQACGDRWRMAIELTLMLRLKGQRESLSDHQSIFHQGAETYR